MDGSGEYSGDPFAPRGSEGRAFDVEEEEGGGRGAGPPPPHPGQLLLAAVDGEAPSKHRQAMQAAKAALERVRRTHEATYVEQCVRAALLRTAAIDSVLSAGFGFVGWQIVKGRRAARGRSATLLVPLALALLPWANVLVESNRTAVCGPCYLAVMSWDSDAGRAMRRAYAASYPRSILLLGAEAMAGEEGGESRRLGSYEQWLGRGHALAPLVPRQSAHASEDERPHGGGLHERPGAGPFGLPLPHPSSVLRVPVAHADPSRALHGGAAGGGGESLPPRAAALVEDARGEHPLAAAFREAATARARREEEEGKQEGEAEEDEQEQEEADGSARRRMQ